MECRRIDKIHQIISPLAVITVVFWVMLPREAPSYGFAFLVGMGLAFIVYRYDIMMVFQK